MELIPDATASHINFQSKVAVLSSIMAELKFLSSIRLKESLGRTSMMTVLLQLVQLATEKVKGRYVGI